MDNPIIYDCEMDSEKMIIQWRNILLRDGITAADAERYYGLSRSTVNQWARRQRKFRPGESMKIGRTWYVLPAAVERIMKETSKE
jgi:DNA-binding transcriptional regulator YdaS (Cro superfamily)